MFKQIQTCELTVSEKWCYGFLVTYPVSYQYNGLVTIDGKLYEGFDVPSPKVPSGFKFFNIGCGLQLNAQPPYATVYLEPLTPEAKAISKKKATLKAFLAAQ